MPPRARSAWFRTLGQLVLVLALAAVGGWAVGEPWPVVTAAALGAGRWFTRDTNNENRSTTDTPPPTPPSSPP